MGSSSILHNQSYTLKGDIKEIILEIVEDVEYFRLEILRNFGQIGRLEEFGGRARKSRPIDHGRLPTNARVAVDDKAEHDTEVGTHGNATDSLAAMAARARFSGPMECRRR
jgi:hypothetical protein